MINDYTIPRRRSLEQIAPLVSYNDFLTLYLTDLFDFGPLASYNTAAK